MEPLIKIEHLYRYYGDRCAVQDLGLELQRGEVLGLLGPNGAGKSTTLGMIAGNLAPSSGEIRLNGVDLLKHPLKAKAGLGYLPENPPLYRELSVDEYLQFCARLRAIPRGEVQEAASRAKERCGLTEVARRLIGNLSKGYQQRVGIAQAIIHDPAVVILDEPTVGLDPIQIREIRELIRELGKEHGVILSTHILPEVQSVCSRVLILHQGRIAYAEQLGDAKHQATDLLYIRLDNPPPPEQIAALAGVKQVERLELGGFRLQVTNETRTVSALAKQLSDGGWGLLEFTPKRRSLEQIFMRITSGEAA
jgi:ABC-2 type transport system ATP-binding protein